MLGMMLSLMVCSIVFMFLVVNLINIAIIPEDEKDDEFFVDAV